MLRVGPGTRGRWLQRAFPSNAVILSTAARHGLRFHLLHLHPQHQPIYCCFRPSRRMSVLFLISRTPATPNGGRTSRPSWGSMDFYAISTARRLSTGATYFNFLSDVQSPIATNYLLDRLFMWFFKYQVKKNQQESPPWTGRQVLMYSIANKLWLSLAQSTPGQIWTGVTG